VNNLARKIPKIIDIKITIVPPAKNIQEVFSFSMVKLEMKVDKINDGTNIYVSILDKTFELFSGKIFVFIKI
jgi:hypothetical protein